jgi:hypothetical protein
VTDDARRRVCAYVRCLADEMGLRDWTVHVLDDPPDDRRKVAEADCVYGRKRINISLSDQFFRLDSEKGPDGQRQTLVHELIHAHLAPMHLLLHRILPDAQWEAYQLPMEYAVDGMAEGWARHLPLPSAVEPKED